ncbi:fibroblast growth factor receptor 4-like [Stegodyphus dumicola]|uniref:fibroblast growth factor receptor 4-like n=1 Tax=Stegodyphus dumicola TaxID=202533 RepID=UPI0015AC6AD3|nr:fibroblast growth factor receptor 4-like [Stegodyphus dumicola]
MEYFYVLPSNKTVHVGEVATFECKFNGSHDTVEWVKYYEVNGFSLNEFGVPYMKRVQYRSINHIKASHLTLQNVTFDDAGKYACVVSNKFGNCRQYTWLTVLPK